MKISGNTIFITGGTSGLGLAFVERYLELGNKVIICGRREDRLKSLKTKHPSLITFKCDVSDSLQREKITSSIIQEHPDVNILMNNAGIQLVADLTKPVNIDNIKLEIETNLTAPIHLASLFSQHLATKSDGA